MLLSSLDQNYILIYFNFDHPPLETIQMWVHEWTFSVSASHNERQTVSPPVRQNLVKGFCSSVWIFFFLWVSALVFSKLLLVFTLQNQYGILGSSAPFVPGVVTLFEKVRGSFWKTGSCSCVLWEPKKILMVENSLFISALCLLEKSLQSLP